MNAARIIATDEATLYTMRAEIVADLTELFGAGRTTTRLNEWLSEIQAPSTIAHEAATAAAAVLLAFERGYRMSADETT